MRMNCTGMARLECPLEMETVHSAGLLWMNDHSWYRIETTADYVRAALWCLSNLPFKTMALISLATAVVVRRERRLIVAALEGAGAALTEGDK
jgi:hypothetical protein